MKLNTIIPFPSSLEKEFSKQSSSTVDYSKKISNWNDIKDHPTIRFFANYNLSLSVEEAFTQYRKAFDLYNSSPH